MVTVDMWTAVVLAAVETGGEGTIANTGRVGDRSSRRRDPGCRMRLRTRERGGRLVSRRLHLAQLGWLSCCRSVMRWTASLGRRAGALLPLRPRRVRLEHARPGSSHGGQEDDMGQGTRAPGHQGTRDVHTVHTVHAVTTLQAAMSCPIGVWLQAEAVYSLRCSALHSTRARHRHTSPWPDRSGSRIHQPDQHGEDDFGALVGGQAHIAESDSWQRSDILSRSRKERCYSSMLCPIVSPALRPVRSCRPPWAHEGQLLSAFLEQIGAPLMSLDALAMCDDAPMNLLDSVPVLPLPEAT
nr:hypothetical protein CFP56_04306 [Quercus suber]